VTTNLATVTNTTQRVDAFKQLDNLFKYTHRLNNKLTQNEILKKNYLLLIIVDVSASTGALVRMDDEGSSRSRNVINNN